MLVALLLGETTINYIDRQVVSVLAPTLRTEFSMSNSQYAAIVNAFLATYAVSYTFAGWALDRLGVGRGLTLSVIWWSIGDSIPRLIGASQGPVLSAFPGEICCVTGRPGRSSCAFFADPLWYFFVFWIPEFLARERGLNLAGIGQVAWIPFLVAGAANFVGGYLSLVLQRSGWSVNRTRKSFMVVATILTPVGIFAAFAHSLFWTIALISFAVFFWIFWSIAVHSLAGDYFPANAVASVYGIAGTGSTVGSAISTWAVGYVLDQTHSYPRVFIGLSLLMPVALVVGFSLMGRVEPVAGVEPQL
jgi:ACS family hexuronate transporter-like MFS transporter